MKLRRIFPLMLALLLAFSLAFTGCANPDAEDDSHRRDEEEEEEIYQADPEEALETCEDFFDAYRELDSAKTGSLLTGMGEPYPFGTLTGILARNMQVDLEAGALEEDMCRIPATIETVDLQAVFRGLPDTIASTEEASAWLADALSADDAPRQTYAVEVLMVLDGEDWKVELTGALSNALLGGYFSLLDELSGEVE